MVNKKVLIFATILFVGVSIWGAFVLVGEQKSGAWSNSGDSQQQTRVPESGGEVTKSGGLVLFYSNSCPHCKNVEKYISDNGILEKISIDQKEVSSGDNSTQLVIAAKKCGIASDKIGVPFLWDGAKCYVGDTPIIDFLNDKLSEK